MQNPMQTGAEPTFQENEPGAWASRESGLEAKVARYLPRLSQMSTQLKQTSAQIEDSVVEVCNSFNDIAVRARASTVRTAEWLGEGGTNLQRQGSFESLIEACESTMVTLINAFAASGQIAQRAVERIHKVDETARQIGLALGKLDTISHGNKILALNARIEAARAGEHASGFAAVAVELSSQTDKSREVSSQVSDLAEHLRVLADSTLSDLQGMQGEDRKRAQQCKADVDDTLGSLRGTHEHMRRMLTMLSEESALLASDINSAVRGLQFQDRVSQRIAHVVADLEVMQARLSAHESSGVDYVAEDPDEGFSSQVMEEERLIYGVVGNESAAGDIDLF